MTSASTSRWFWKPLFALAAFCLPTPVSAYGAAELRVVDVLGAPYRTVLVPIQLTSDTNVVAAQFDLVWASTNLTSGAAQPGPALGDHRLPSNEPATRTRRVLIYSPTNGPLANGTLVQIPVTLASNTPLGDIALALTNVVLSAEDGTPVAGVSCVPGSLTVLQEIPDSPVITGQPQSQNLWEGQTLSLSVTATGTPPLSLQWRRNSANFSNDARINGTTSNLLTISNVQTNDAGSYSVVVTNVAGVATSQTAVVTVDCSPRILLQPQDQVAPAAATVSFSVICTGAPPLAYQWRRYGTNLADGSINGTATIGSKTTTLTLVGIQSPQMGEYSVLVSNACGTVLSSSAWLRLWPLVAWGDNSRNQTTIPANLTNVIAVAAAGYHSLALKSNGTVVAWGLNSSGQTNVPTGLSSVAAVAVGELHSLVLKSNGTILAWGDNSYGQTNVPAGLGDVVAIAAGGQHNLALKSDSKIVSWGNNFYGQTNVPTGLSDVVAIAAGGYHNLALKSDGTVVAWGAGYYGQTNVPPGLSNIVAVSAGGGQSVALKSDGTVAVWGYSGVADLPAALTNVIAISAGGLAMSPPPSMRFPRSLALKADGSVVGWGIEYPPEAKTNAPAAVTNVVGVYAGGVHSLVCEADGSPVFTVEPWSRVATQGDGTVLNVMVAGARPMTYQWRLNGTNLPGATESALVLSFLQSSDSGIYQFIASNALGVRASREAILSVSAAPQIVIQPASQTVHCGDNAAFAATATGNSPLNYQWRFNGMNLANNARISGATTNMLTIANVQTNDAGSYSVLVTNAYGTAVSSNALLTVLSSAVTFTDPRLEAAVRAALSMPTGAITRDDMLRLTSLSANSLGITNLSGLEWALNATFLELVGNQIADAGPLAALPRLTILNLGGNQITNIGLLGNLTQLQRLWLNDSSVSDVAPVAGLTNLVELHLWNCGVTDIAALAGLKQLQILNLGINQITNIAPLVSLPQLQRLTLNDSPLGNVTLLAGLTNLVELNLWNCRLTDITPLASMNKLEILNLGVNQITNIALLAQFPQLQRLFLNESPIRDAAPLEGLTNLVELNLWNCQLGDTAPLTAMSKLEVLSLGYDRLTEVGLLAGLTQLRLLWLSGNQIADISPLSGLTNLMEVSLWDNWITNIAPISSLPSLSLVELRWNFLDVSPGSPARTIIDSWLGEGVTVYYTGQSTAPKISPMGDQTVLAGETLPPIPFRVADDLTPAGDLIVTANSSNPLLLENAGIALGGSGADRTVQLSPIPGQGGQATVTLTVSDGGQSGSTSFRLTVLLDTNPPNTIVLSGPAEGGAVCALPVNLSWSGTDDMTPARALLYSWQLDNGAWSAWSSETNTASASLAEGAHFFAVRAKDLSGSEDPTPALRGFSVDTLAPGISGVGATPSAASCVITWVTDESATAQVEYGLTAGYGSSTPRQSQLATNHGVTVSGLTPDSTYHYRVKSQDGCGHEAISTDHSFSTAPLPDLQVVSVSAPAEAWTGTPFELSWTVTNARPVTAAGAWVDRVFVSHDDQPGDDFLLGEVVSRGNLAGGQNLISTQAFSIARGDVPAGIYHLAVLTDATNNVAEGFGETNNFFVSAQTVTLRDSPVPDLLVEDLTVTNPAGEGQCLFQWKTANRGDGTAPAGFKERVWVKNLSNGRLQLDVERLVTQPVPTNAMSMQSAWVQATEPGTWQVRITTDSSGMVYEYNASGHLAAEENNSIQAEFPITLPQPDLVATAVTAPASAQSLEVITATWTVSNQGSAPAPPAWWDYLYLSRSPTLNTQAVYLGGLPWFDAVAIGGAYTQTQQVRLPNLESGAYYLILQTDVANTLAEVTETNNAVASAAIQVAAAPLPDLLATDIQAPNSCLAGQRMQVTWVVTNQGNATAAAPWAEKVCLAIGTNVTGSNLLAVLFCTNSLGAGQSLVRTQEVAVPLDGLAGDLQLFVEVDSDHVLTELDKTNNIGFTVQPVRVPLCLSLQLSATQTTETTNSPALTGTVWRNGDTVPPLTVGLTNNKLGRLIVPASVIIPAGHTWATFGISVPPDGVITGPQLAELWASADGYYWDGALLTVLDADQPRLTLQVAQPELVEGQTSTASVSRDMVSSNALNVTLTRSQPGQVLLPSSVTIPANEPSVSFVVQAADDTLVEATNSYSLTALASGFTSGSAAVTVIDNAWPQVQAHVTTRVLLENLGPQAATLLLTRTPATDRALNVALESSAPSLLTVPAVATIPARSPSVTVPVGVIDNQVLDGPRQVTIRVFILDSVTQARLCEGVSDQVTVLDDEGPTLKVTLSRHLTAEGLAQAATGTVSRNTGTENALTVTLASSDTSEATVPDSVTILAGQTSVDFAVATVQDGLTDGNQTVTITASAPGYNAGGDWLVVSDVDLPDLMIASVAAPTNAIAGGQMQVTFRLENQGIGTAAGTWVQRVYLSGDRFLSTDDSLLGEFPFNVTLPPGQHFSQTVTVFAPRLPADYCVIVVADAAGAIAETLEDNNASAASVPLQIEPPFTATVQADLSSAPAGTPVPLHGSATRVRSTSPAANELVNIHIVVKGTRRIISALADAQGQFTATFTPLRGEGGLYQVGAAAPGVEQAPISDQFVLLGMKASPDRPVHTLVSLGSVTGQASILNLSDLPLTDLSATVQGATHLDVTVSVTNYLPGSESIPLQYSIQSLQNESAQGVFNVHLASAEGAVLDLPIRLTVVPLEASLQARPGSLVEGMVRGTSRTVEINLVNLGGFASRPLQVVLPNVTWMHVASTNPLPSLAPGEVGRLVLLLQPPFDLPLGEYTGSLAVNGDHCSLTLPFSIRHVSNVAGDLRVTAVDEMAFNGANPTNLAGAHVVLRDPYNGQVVASGTTDAGGVFFAAALPEGIYNLEVTALKHDVSTSTVTIIPGQVNEKRIFLRTQFVTYRWTVEEIEVEDRTRIVLEPVFEASVPAPVVTVEPSLIDLAQVPVEGQQIDLTIANHGLIAADNLKINLGTHPLWTLTPLISELDSLAAQSSITIPVMIRHSTAGSTKPTSAWGLGSRLAKDADDEGPCQFQGHVEYDWVCGPLNIGYQVPVYVVDAVSNCNATVIVPVVIPTDPQTNNHTVIIPSDGSGGWSWGDGGGIWEIGFGTNDWNRQDGSVVIHPVTPIYVPTSNCACDPTNYHEQCLSGELGVKLDLLKQPVIDAVNKLLETTRVPPSPVPLLTLDDVALKVTAAGELCTCCETSVQSLKGKVEGGLDWEVVLQLGPRIPEIDTEINVPGLGPVKAKVKIFGGIEFTLYGNVKPVVETECGLGSYKVCLEGRPLGLKVNPGLRGTAELTLPGNAEPVGQMSLFAGLESGLSLKLEGCLDSGLKLQLCSDDIVAKISGEADIIYNSRKYHAGLEYSYTLATGRCYPTNAEAAAIQPAGLAAVRVLNTVGAESARTVTGALVTSPQLPPGTTPVTLDGTSAFGGNRPRRVCYACLPARPAASAVSIQSPPTMKADSPASGPKSSGPDSFVCAQVRLRIEQEAVLTRKAVGATLELDNNSGTLPLDNVGVGISIYDAAGNVANDRFVILPPELTAFSRIPGSDAGTNILSLVPELWQLGPASTGRARWVILPKDEAAPNGPVVYYVGGFLSYSSAGAASGTPLIAAPVTVYPNPKLKLDYFLQRDVYSDDPFTPEVEPAVPFSLGIMVRNIGGGEAKNFYIASAQPKVIDNEKGLLIDFNILATEVGGQSLAPSLTANFGTILPNETRVGRWLMRSSLQGFFVDYRAWFEHEEKFGGRAACLIDSVTMHEMIRVVRAGGGWEDGLFDFLVNDGNDTQHLPDTLYLSNGTTNPVTAVLSATASGAPMANALTVQLTAAMPMGWAYLRVPDPGNGQFRLARVVRSDGLEVSVGTNAWTTDRTFVGVGQRPLNENRLHLLDYNSPGTYTLYYELIPAADHAAPQSSVATLPADSSEQIPLQWNGSDSDGSGIAWYDVYVSADGSQFVPWLQKTHLNGAIFQGLLGVHYAFYSVATDNAGNQEASPSTPDAETFVSLTNSPPILAAIADQTIDEGDTLRLIVSATDPNGPASGLVFSLDSGSPPGAAIHPATGQVVWPTTEAHGPSTNIITVRVTDSGTPRLSSTRTFWVVVREVNSPPVLPGQPNRTVYLGQTLSLDLLATDPDLPANHLAYALLAGPKDMALNPASGRLTWTPSLAQWPSTNVVAVMVTDDGSPPLNTTNSFLVVVASANHPPTLAVIPDQVTQVGRALTITNLATDPDGPSQSLTFEFGSGVPAGATLNPTNGIFTWTPTCAQGSTTNAITIRVTDNGLPPMSDSRMFMVTVPECIEASLGNTVMLAGTTSAVPVRLLSTTVLTNMAFRVVYPAERFATNFNIMVNSPQVLTQQVRLIAPGLLEVSFTLPETSVLHGPTNVGELGLTALPLQSSAFVPLAISEVMGSKPNGSEAANWYGYPGRVVVIGPEPLLEALPSDKTNVILTLYGNPGTNYLMRCSTNLLPAVWLEGWWVPMTNLWETWKINVTEPQLFYRAE